MRKVKFAQQTFHDKLSAIITQFPKIESIHPFYADLANVLYDKDHFKIALGQVSNVTKFIDRIAKEYVKLLKYADSPFKCKMLKKAALGRMCTLVRKLKDTLAYLEEVRRHLSRLPNINVFSKTLLLAGHPNVGKSTFMNVLSNANVETANWAFTTRSLYVGHFDYQLEKWQVIDTPGILDRPLNARNTIEMTSIVSLAHLPAAILFLIDISTTCGYTIEEQVNLLISLAAVLKNKPVVVVLNKIDICKPSEISQEELNLIHSLSNYFEFIQFVGCSTKTGEGLDEAKNKACEMLVALRKRNKLLSGKSVVNTESSYVSNVQPNPQRPAYIPPVEETKQKLTLDSISEYINKQGGAGVFSIGANEKWLLANDDWKNDKFPEFFEGKNIYDFIDEDICAKLETLEKEEQEIELLWNKSLNEPTEQWYELKNSIYEMRVEAEAKRLLSIMKRSKSSAINSRQFIDTSEFKKRLEELNIEPEDVLQKLKTISTDIDSDYVSDEDDYLMSNSDTELNKEDINVDVPQISNSDNAQSLQKRIRKFKLARRTGAKGIKTKLDLLPKDRKSKGFKNHPELLAESEKHIKKIQKRFVTPGSNQQKWQSHESDRFIGTMKPKHIFSGKRSNGKTDRR